MSLPVRCWLCGARLRPDLARVLARERIVVDGERSFHGSCWVVFLERR